MAIPNVKRFRAFCPTCNDNFTLMAVLPMDAVPQQGWLEMRTTDPLEMAA
jgi:hypothetical protein